MAREFELFEDKQGNRKMTATNRLHRITQYRVEKSRRWAVRAGTFSASVNSHGASAAVHPEICVMLSPIDLALLQVQDTLIALHKLAPNYRQLMPQPSVSIVPFQHENHPGRQSVNFQGNP